MSAESEMVTDVRDIYVILRRQVKFVALLRITIEEDLNVEELGKQENWELEHVQKV